MIISIASGKGGTGKTTVATNIAVSVEGPVQLLDCDVEEPNAHLFLRPEIEESRVVTTPVPKIDLDRCDRCRKCAQICRFKAIAVAGDLVLTFPELCHSCGGCMAICPQGAITETGRELGVVETGAMNGVSFVHGRMRVGEAMSPPLIRLVRERTWDRGLTLIDAPPGTSCPVIAAMKNTDFVLLVTEPTPFGLHDLKLAVEAVRTLGIPMGLVLNRSDLGDDKVKDYAQSEGVPILMEIPFDRQIAESYSRGEMFVQVLPEWRTRFRNLVEQIKTLVEKGGETK
ncbi:cobyrinic acid a,c-diamide synthase [Desulfosarcina widdelii]|uniref:Cobyrinic acid a,c-diamide synthase n=1 Tax=Desulfosarcina widdelii TaxID=947919 RepID=A0A5K7Z3M3_9BACT|nr:ATP-binding protein [Desulfosarcina widdelii]BBO75270.1 cobyrinic acid a,c-diamide synthase [Desulfosarcina widdelii]